MIAACLTLSFILIVASTWWFGLWSNLITLVNLILSAMIASSFYINVSTFFGSYLPSYKVMFPFVSIWLVFAISFIGLRVITDTISSMRLRFDFLTETIGRSLLALTVAWVFVSFAMFSLHLAPLPPSLFSDPRPANEEATSNESSKASPETFGPGSLWAGFIRSRSVSSFAASREAGFFPADRRTFTVNEKEAEYESRVFDPLHQFFSNAAANRRSVSVRKTLRTGGASSE